MRSPMLSGRVTRLECVGLLMLATIPVVFGVLVEIRGAFLKTRHTDLAVFARAAWAVRNGVDVYSIPTTKDYTTAIRRCSDFDGALADPPRGVCQNVAVLGHGRSLVPLSVIAAFRRPRWRTRLRKVHRNSLEQLARAGRAGGGLSGLSPC